MLENRSFDHMLGFINDTNISKYSNSYTYGTPPKQHIYHPKTPARCRMQVDPGHDFLDVLMQLSGPLATYPPAGKYPAIDNSGFVDDYATPKTKWEGGGAKNNFCEIMRCYDTRKQLPVMTALADNFTVCDNWFASMPGPTWPNRFFVHAASSGGLDHSPSMGELLEWESWHHFSFPHGTIYNRLDKKNKKYRLYRGVSWPPEGAIPGVAALKGINIWDTRDYKYFEDDVNGDYPYDYTFIEPNYGDIISNTYKGGQSQHPMDDVRSGEALIKSTYEALRCSPIWENSLLLITYDEHGGFYDHVAPPPAKGPGDTDPNIKYNRYHFTFEQYGVRVPAIVVSAYTRANQVDHTLFDHSSVPATLETMYGMLPLTQRDTHANNFTSLASLAAKRDTPEKLPDVGDLCPDDDPNPCPEDDAAMPDNAEPLNEELAPVDGGNLPGFLHVVLKAELEAEPTKSLVAQTAILANFQAIQTRAQAREYIESRLPGLLAMNEGLAEV